MENDWFAFFFTAAIFLPKPVRHKDGGQALQKDGG